MQRRTCQVALSTLGRRLQSSAIIDSSDPFAVLSLPSGASRDELRTQFFKLARTHHPSLTGNVEVYQKVVNAYESAIKVADDRSPIAPWDGISGMSYSQAWQGKDFWRKKWENHWATRLAHMYKHQEEMDEIEQKMNLREAQYNQVRDWMVYSKHMMDHKTKTEWDKYCELWRGQILWVQTNKKNYKRYYISNQNVPAHMEEVYKEHEFWRKFEDGQWADWEAFFNQAKKWVVDNEKEIRSAHNLEGPLLAKYNYLMKDRYESKLIPKDQMALMVAADLAAWRRLVYWRQAARHVRFVAIYFERILRATFPLFLAVLLMIWYYDMKFILTVFDPNPSPKPSTGPVQMYYRELDIVTWATEKWEKLQKKYSYDNVMKRVTDKLPKQVTDMLKK